MRLDQLKWTILKNCSFFEKKMWRSPHNYIFSTLAIKWKTVLPTNIMVILKVKLLCAVVHIFVALFPWKRLFIIFVWHFTLNHKLLKNLTSYHKKKLAYAGIESEIMFSLHSAHFTNMNVTALIFNFFFTKLRLLNTFWQAMAMAMIKHISETSEQVWRSERN